MRGPFFNNFRAAARHFSLQRSLNVSRAKVTRRLLIGVVVAICVVAFVNVAVVVSTSGSIMTPEDAAAWGQMDGDGADAVLVLGAAVWDGKPSPILADRLDAGMRTFGAGASQILLLSGDNGTIWYNEVQGMKDYVLKNGAIYGITDANIYLDYAGFSTYYSLYRFRDVFQGQRVVIVTQRYHLYRALFNAKMLGIDAVGVAAPDRSGGQLSRDLREIPARVKDFFLAVTRIPPRVLGDPIPLVYPSTQAASQ